MQSVKKGDKGTLERLFELKKNKTNVKTEFLAGLTIFLTSCSILAVNPAILSASGMEPRAIFWATAIVSAIACIMMGLLTNYPFALAPALGLNAYFAFVMCGEIGLSWQNALACVFIEGTVFCVLSIIGIQEKIVNAIPNCLKHAISAAIGLFIAFAGLGGAGVIVSDPDTLIKLGNLSNPGVLLTLLGIAIIAGLIILNVKGSMLIGILIITGIGLFIRNPETMQSYTTWKGIIAFDNPITAMAPTFGKLSFSGLFAGPTVVVVGVVFAIFSLLFVDLFNSIGVLLGVGVKAGLVNEKGELPKAGKALFVSAAGAAIGAVLGTSTVTVYGAESATGIAEGGRTGLTAISTGLFYILALLFSPLFLMIPTIATAPALVVVGVFMMEPLMGLELNKMEIAFPVFICIAFMVFSFNVAYGILFGLLAYTIGQVFAKKANAISTGTWILSIVFAGYLLLNILLK